ncbi:hypothetical protein [Breoghania sp. JC706]|uniref:hypothetical protein n=1 Tax=Breoghania sp. JC706 TaxID=3117732 RepID=UPI0030086A01
MSVEDDGRGGGLRAPWREPPRNGTLQDAQTQIRRAERSLLAWRDGSVRREAGFAEAFAGIEAQLSAILATPLLRHDAHCQSLVLRIARVGTMEDFASRVADFERHVRRIAGQTFEGDAGAYDPVAPSQTGLSRLCGERPVALTGGDVGGDRAAYRTRLKL